MAPRNTWFIFQIIVPLWWFAYTENKTSVPSPNRLAYLPERRAYPRIAISDSPKLAAQPPVSDLVSCRFGFVKYCAEIVFERGCFSFSVECAVDYPDEMTPTLRTPFAVAALCCSLHVSRLTSATFVPPDKCYVCPA